MVYQHWTARFGGFFGLRAVAAACEYEVRQLAGLGLPPRSEAPGPGPAGGTSRSPSPRSRLPGAPGGGYRPLPPDPPRAELWAVPRDRRGGPGGLRALALDRVPTLHPGQQPAFRRKLQAAYAQPTYAEAKATLGRLAKELQLVNPLAVESLQQGLEETVTLHRLGLAGTLGASLQTTNCLEAMFVQAERWTAQVDHWRTTDQKQRCMAAALLDSDPRLQHPRNAGRCLTNPGKCFAISTKNALDTMESCFPHHKSRRP
jgi:hypothetical protein